MRKFLSLLSVSFALTACAMTQDPTKITFSDSIGKSLLLIKIDPARVPYKLVLASYNEADKTIGATFSGWYFLEPKSSTEPQYLAKIVDPGTYVFGYLMQQEHWAVCFSEQTRSFAVKPSQAVFLGEFDPAPNLAQLQLLVTDKGETKASVYQYNFYLDGILPPQISNPASQSADFLEAKSYESQFLPMLDGRLEPVAYKAATFRNRATLGNGERNCGG